MSVQAALFSDEAAAGVETSDFASLSVYCYLLHRAFIRLHKAYRETKEKNLRLHFENDQTLIRQREEARDRAARESCNASQWRSEAEGWYRHYLVLLKQYEEAMEPFGVTPEWGHTRPDLLNRAFTSMIEENLHARDVEWWNSLVGALAKVDERRVGEYIPAVQPGSPPDIETWVTALEKLAREAWEGKSGRGR